MQYLQNQKSLEHSLFFYFCNLAETISTVKKFSTKKEIMYFVKIVETFGFSILSRKST